MSRYRYRYRFLFRYMCEKCQHKPEKRSRSRRDRFEVLQRNLRDIFLRELISNISDALDKIRFLSLQIKRFSVKVTMLSLQIKLDKEKKILSIRNRGIGMTNEDLIKNLGTIAKSGTSAFVKKMQTIGDLNLIGYVWESNADGAFAISEDTWNESLGCGTEIRLHLKEESGEYMENSKLKVLLKTIKNKLIWKALDGDKLEPKILVHILS
ncbi:hypothetical protein Q3G72_006003 [Acer saccharum]|nr:hypothetical protein Q3G72_006003 [Acer saccharum]